ncbi:transposase [Parafrankia elaeagni]|uniref:transposase n=1 Tax=Parafrankia elaeagni TaxID=222534 RepID=UPI0012B5B612|nr:transposase [Parafrankia elaeagni]
MPEGTGHLIVVSGPVFLCTTMLDRIDSATTTITDLTARIEVEIAPFVEAVDRLDGIPGINARIAQIIIAETGGGTARFPIAGHLASWAGLCPGNNESAGKHHADRTRRDDTWLRGSLGEAASSASRSKATYLSAHYRRIATHRDSKRARVAVSHTMLVIAWSLLHDQIHLPRPRPRLPSTPPGPRTPDPQTRPPTPTARPPGHPHSLTLSYFRLSTSPAGVRPNRK